MLRASSPQGRLRAPGPQRAVKGPRGVLSKVYYLISPFLKMIFIFEDIFYGVYYYHQICFILCMLSEEFGFAARCIKGCCTMRCVLSSLRLDPDVVVLLHLKGCDVHSVILTFSSLTEFQKYLHHIISKGQYSNS
jgi:hypothetical protein